jgi:site-specific recombinase XerD
MLGSRIGNWLTANEARTLWQLPNPAFLKGKRDRALMATLLGCGLRRRESAGLDFGHLQRRDEHWAIVDLIGKEGHMRTIPVPDGERHSATLQGYAERAAPTPGAI